MVIIAVMENVFHYPPELLDLLIQAIPLLHKGKTDLLTFFEGAGVPEPMLADLRTRVQTDRGSINKYEIARTVLTRINQAGECLLAVRREVIKRVVDFQNFASCWPKDHFAAKGLVADIQKLVHAKDTFTRINDERLKERQKHQHEREREIEKKRKLLEALASIRKRLSALFGEQDAHRRGKALEGVLNDLFAAYGILVREAFALKVNGLGVVEQIDGVIELDGHIYIVEMKWWSEPLGPGDVAQHLVRVFARGQTRGIFISNSGYTEAALLSCGDSLRQAVFVLCELEEFFWMLEHGADLKTILKEKIVAAMLDKLPLKKWRPEAVIAAASAAPAPASV